MYRCGALGGIGSESISAPRDVINWHVLLSVLTGAEFLVGYINPKTGLSGDVASLNFGSMRWCYIFNCVYYVYWIYLLRIPTASALHLHPRTKRIFKYVYSICTHSFCTFLNGIIHQFQHTIICPNIQDEHINHAQCLVSQLLLLKNILFVCDPVRLIRTRSTPVTYCFCLKNFPRRFGIIIPGVWKNITEIQLYQSLCHIKIGTSRNFNGSLS